jgi:FMN reductase
MTTLLISGSPSFPSRSTRLLEVYGEQLSGLGHDISRLALRNLPAQALLLADASHPELEAALKMVDDADAIVIATPVYKAAYSGLLKIFLDVLPQEGLLGKIVQPLATGGSQSHMLMLDYALRPVLSSMSARQILPSIYAIDQQIQSTERGGTQLELNLDYRINQGALHLAQSLLALQAMHNITTLHTHRTATYG